MLSWLKNQLSSVVYMFQRFWIFLLCLFLFESVNAHQPAGFLKSIEGSKDEGAQVVTHFCEICHGNPPEIQIGAPRMHVFSDWKTRLSQGMPILFKHVDEGLRAMPPRGGCFECSDKQLMLAINSIIGNKGQKYLKNIKKSL